MNFFEIWNIDMYVNHFSGELETFQKFIGAIFYIGKGKRARPYSHLFEALNHKQGKVITKKFLLFYLICIQAQYWCKRFSKWSHILSKRSVRRMGVWVKHNSTKDQSIGNSYKNYRYFNWFIYGKTCFSKAKFTEWSSIKLKGCCYSIYKFDDVTFHINWVDVFGY